VRCPGAMVNMASSSVEKQMGPSTIGRVSPSPVNAVPVHAPHFIGASIKVLEVVSSHRRRNGAFLIEKFLIVNHFKTTRQQLTAGFLTRGGGGGEGESSYG
jgi:hypothetical protein